MGCHYSAVNSTHIQTICHCNLLCTHWNKLPLSWTQLFCIWASLCGASSNSVANSSASFTILLPLFTINSARTVFPSLFCLRTRLISSNLLLILFSRMISTTSNVVYRSFFFLCRACFFLSFFRYCCCLCCRWATKLRMSV